jgi:hypothetical protein
MTDIHFDHIALLVRDIEQSVRDYREILSVLDPVNSAEVVWAEGKEGGHAYRAATFVSQNGKTVIQFLQSAHPKDVERLAKNGECVHHLEFCTRDVHGVNERLKAAGVPLLSDEPVVSESMPWQENIVVSPKKTHGVLVKVTTKYKTVNGNWLADKED